MSDDEKAEFDKKVIKRNIKKDQFVYHQGMSTNDIFIVRSGCFKVMKESKEDCNLLLYLKVPEDIILPESRTNAKFSHSLAAVVDSEICLVERESFLELINLNSGAALNVILNVNTENNRLIERVKEMGFSMSESKLADTLLFANTYLQSVEKNGIEVKRDVLAEISGLSRESVSRMLSSFAKSGLIEIKKNKIFIVDIEGIQSLI